MNNVGVGQGALTCCSGYLSLEKSFPSTKDHISGLLYFLTISLIHVLVYFILVQLIIFPLKFLLSLSLSSLYFKNR